jgi:protein SCO1/2
MTANTARLLALSGCALLSAGCSREAAPTGDRATAVPIKAVAERYPLTGEVLRVEPERKVLIVRHDEIKDYMPAMTMEFLVSDGDLALARPGQRIRAEMIPSKDGDFRLERIWPDDASIEARSVATGAMQLRQDTHTRGKNAFREVGEAAPDFSLYDQNGRVVQGSRFRGRQIMLNFIFSRCPVPTMCPAATAKMISVQRLAREAGVRDLELVSITLDPLHDTPGVMREYAAVRGIDTSNFSFLTGPEGAIRDLLTQFGVITQLQGDILQHTLATLLIDPQGRIAHRTDGSQWEPQDFVLRMKSP